jgi:hypothetical protein
VETSLRALSPPGWVAPGRWSARSAGEPDREAPPAGFSLLAERAHGPARVLFLRPEGGGA